MYWSDKRTHNTVLSPQLSSSIPVDLKVHIKSATNIAYSSSLNSCVFETNKFIVQVNFRNHVSETLSPWRNAVAIRRSGYYQERSLSRRGVRLLLLRWIFLARRGRPGLRPGDLKRLFWLVWVSGGLLRPGAPRHGTCRRTEGKAARDDFVSTPSSGSRVTTSGS